MRSLSQEFREKKFDYVILLCPTYDFDFFVVSPQQDQINDWSKIVSFVSEGANSLIILDECAALKDVKGRTNKFNSGPGIQGQTWGSECLSFNTTTDGHRQAVQRKCRGVGSVLYTFSEGHERDI